MYTQIGAFIGGGISAIISGGAFYESKYHFGVFLACFFVGVAFGSIIDILKKKK